MKRRAADPNERKDQPPLCLRRRDPACSRHDADPKGGSVNERRIRRMAGFLMARLPEAGLEQVPDHRSGPVKWRLPQLLTGVLIGLMAGCRSLRELEQLTDMLSPAVRRKLKLGRRMPGTTLRGALCELPLNELRGVLHRVVKAAWRRKAPPRLVRAWPMSAKVLAEFRP